MTVLTGVSSNVVLCPLNVTRYRTLNIWILNLDHITGPIFILPCFPQVVVFILGIIKLPEFFISHFLSSVAHAKNIGYITSA